MYIVSRKSKYSLTSHTNIIHACTKSCTLCDYRPGALLKIHTNNIVLYKGSSMTVHCVNVDQGSQGTLRKVAPLLLAAQKAVRYDC